MDVEFGLAKVLIFASWVGIMLVEEADTEKFMIGFHFA